MSQTMTETQESELQERMKRVEYDTLDGDTCYAEILDISQTGTDIEMRVELPSGRTYTTYFDMPEVASDSYELVRLLDSIGYGLSAIDDAVGADVTVRITDDGPSIAIPEPPKTRRERAEKLFGYIPDSAVMLAGSLLIYLTLPISSWYYYPRYHRNEWGWEADAMECFLAWLLCTLIWVGGVAVIVALTATVL